MHAKEIFEPEELVSWFKTKAEPFYRAGAWELLLPLYEELLEIVEKKPGPEARKLHLCWLGLEESTATRGITKKPSGFFPEP